MKLRYAMVGGSAGSFIGPIHRMAIRMDDLADLVAGSFSRNWEANAETAALCSIDASRTYADWQTLIAKEKGNIDFLAVCTPNDSHYAITKAALEADIDVFCEKPLSLTLAEATELETLAKAHGRILAIPFTYSGFPMVKLARDLVAKGELGRIDKVVLEYLQGSFRKIDFSKPLDKRNAWKMDPHHSGRSCVVADIGVHGFHLIEYITGLQVSELLADLSSYAQGNRLDDDATIIMKLTPCSSGTVPSTLGTVPVTISFASGTVPNAPGTVPSPNVASGTVPEPCKNDSFQLFNCPKATISVSKIATGEENGMRLRVYGDKASIFWDQESPNYLSVKSAFEPERIYKRKAPYMNEASAAATRNSRIPAGHHEGFIEAFANIYREFCTAVRDRAPHDYPGPHDGVRSMRFVEATLKSHSQGNRWIYV